MIPFHPSRCPQRSLYLHGYKTGKRTSLGKHDEDEARQILKGTNVNEELSLWQRKTEAGWKINLQICGVGRKSRKSSTPAAG
jgi:hypothetical protein